MKTSLSQQLAETHNTVWHNSNAKLYVRNYIEPNVNVTAAKPKKVQ